MTTRTATAHPGIGRDVAGLLAGWRFRFVDEYDLQAGIEQALAQEPAWSVSREAQLDVHCRLDFLVEGCGIEVKVYGSNSAVERQLRRYARFDQVCDLVLVTTRMRHLQIPRDVGCPLYVVVIPGVL